MKSKWLSRIGTSGALALGLVASGMAGAAETAPTQPAEVWPYLNKLAAEERLPIIEREAAREGKFTWYGSVAIDRAEVFIKLFNEKYPNIRVDFIGFSEPQVPEKLLLEARTSRVRADVVLTNVTYLDMVSDLLAPYEPTSWADFDPRFKFGGEQDGWTATAFEVLLETIAWRTDRVGADEIPTKLDDLLDDRWKGRMGTTAYFERFIDAMTDVYGEEEAMKRVRRLAELDNWLYRTYAATSSALASGEIDLTWQMLSHRPAKLKQDGAPVDYVIQIPSFGLANLITAIEEAENPYSAALFLEFSTRPEVLEAMDRLEGGRAFGNLKGSYSIDVSAISELTMYKPIPTETFNEYNRIGEELFVRR